MKIIKASLLILFLFLVTYNALSQENFEWPRTPASEVFQDFLAAYNTGYQKKIASFVNHNYDTTDSIRLATKTEYWMDIYFRFGPIKVHSLSINKPLDLEVWVQGITTKIWFAPEFILNKDSKKIRATGMLLGMQPPNTATPSDSKDEFLSRLTNYLDSNEQQGLFQGTVLIQHNDNTILHKGYGLKNIEAKQPNLTSTRMRTASVTKPITAIAILQLVQQGLLNLNQPISKYLPDLPEHIAEKITIYQLLTHTSGYELDGIDGFREELRETNSMSEVYATQLKYLPKWEGYKAFNSPQKYNYANDSYDLLAIIIENISGISFPEYLKKNIFVIAKMPNTYFTNENISSPYRYDLRHGSLMNHESYYPNSWGRISGAASIKTTVEDLKNLFITIKNTSLLLDISHKSLLLAPLIVRGGSEFQSLGLKIYNDPVLNIGHGGTNIGNTAELFYFPASDYLLVVLCNNRSGAPNLYNFFKNNIPN